MSRRKTARKSQDLGDALKTSCEDRDSKVILSDGNLSTTQRYLGTVSDVEAMRWIDNLYG